MGCFGSRLESRNKGALASFNSVGIQFIGGIADGEEIQAEDKYSADQFVYLQKEGETIKELVELYPTTEGKATDKEKAEHAAEVIKGWAIMMQAAFTVVCAKMEKEKNNVTESGGGKFTGREILDQLDEMIEIFKKNEHGAPKEDAPAEERKEDASAEGAEGGEEEGLQFDGGMATTDPRLASVDDQEYKGFAEIPALFLRCALVNEFFGDCVKQRILDTQFNGKDFKNRRFFWIFILDCAAGYIESHLHTSAKETQDVWFSGLVGDEDQLSLGELQKDAKISFPGFMSGWTTEDDAKNYLKALENRDKVENKQVIYKVTGAPCVKVLGNRLVVQRLSGVVTESKVDKIEDAIGLTTVSITANPYDERTLKQSIEDMKKGE